ncbi:hypothetical protein N0B31_11865 [Salinirubellus salinus]|uniref:DUF8048 domain-containing protein n=1 Tax=Salinirubellus salinus TaxID=1364945 RepID=A0A9E7U6X0_9EURY|nr:hypothetical protein [Salinirubellus salinus]UWM52846.1 hypothetical protein N0B31_11865 [Salinirubellus salinus]
MANGDPLDGEVLLLAGAKASLSPRRLPVLVDAAQAHLRGELARYRREYEAVYEDDRFVVFLVEPDHWDGLAATLGVNDRERDALRRAHAEQLRWVGRDADRLDEFESALEIREAVVVGTGPESEGEAGTGVETGTGTGA